MKNIRNRESGTLGTSSNNYRGGGMGGPSGGNGYDFDDDQDEMRQNFGRDINEEDASIPMSNIHLDSQNSGLDSFSKRP